MASRTRTVPPRRRERTEEVKALGPWFHNLHLPDGTQTAPDHYLGDFPKYKWEALAPLVPPNLDGWTALDIGCNAGYYSFELARRGARVTGIDVDPHYLRQARWAAEEYGLSDVIDFRKMQVYELARRGKRFDLVLFMGVFYHLRYPLLGLDIVARCTRRMMIFQTLTSPGMEVYGDTLDHAPAAVQHMHARQALRHPGWPTMAFIEHRFAGDPTNWWIPNHSAVEAMLRSSGMVVRSTPGQEIYVCEPASPEAPLRTPYDFSAELRSATGEAEL